LSRSCVLHAYHTASFRDGLLFFGERPVPLGERKTIGSIATL